MAKSYQKLYQQLVDARRIVPVAEVPNQFRYPSLLTSVPTFTSYGVADTRGLSEEQIAQLERSTNPDK